MKSTIKKIKYILLRCLVGVGLLIGLHIIITPMAEHFETQQVQLFLWQTLIMLFAFGFVEKSVKLIRSKSKFIEYIRMIKNYNFVILLSWIINFSFYTVLQIKGVSPALSEQPLFKYYSPISLGSIAIQKYLIVVCLIWVVTTVILLEFEYNKEFYIRDYGRTKSFLLFILFTLLFAARIILCLYFINENTYCRQLDTYEGVGWFFRSLALCIVLSVLLFRSDRYIFNVFYKKTSHSFKSLYKAILESIVFLSLLIPLRTSYGIELGYEDYWVYHESFFKYEYYFPKQTTAVISSLVIPIIACCAFVYILLVIVKKRVNQLNNKIHK